MNVNADNTANSEFNFCLLFLRKGNPLSSRLQSITFLTRSYWCGILFVLVLVQILAGVELESMQILYGVGQSQNGTYSAEMEQCGLLGCRQWNGVAGWANEVNKG